MHTRAGQKGKTSDLLTTGGPKSRIQAELLKLMRFQFTRRGEMAKKLTEELEEIQVGFQNVKSKCRRIY